MITVHKRLIVLYHSFIALPLKRRHLRKLFRFLRFVDEIRKLDVMGINVHKGELVFTCWVLMRHDGVGLHEERELGREKWE